MKTQRNMKAYLEWMIGLGVAAMLIAMFLVCGSERERQHRAFFDAGVAFGVRAYAGGWLTNAPQPDFGRLNRMAWQDFMDGRVR